MSLLPPHYHDQNYLSNYSAIFTNVDDPDLTLNQGWPIINYSEQWRKLPAYFVKYLYSIFCEI
jgi:hypothetical protein